jgi:hypothetical protein
VQILFLLRQLPSTKEVLVSSASVAPARPHTEVAMFYSTF